MDKKRKRSSQLLSGRSKENTSANVPVNKARTEEVRRSKVKQEEEEAGDPDIAAINKHFPSLHEQYRLLDKIGEGTFSTVYKAIDVRHAYFDNSAWEACTNAPVIFHPCDSDKTEKLPEKELRNTTQKNNERVFGLQMWRYVAVKRVYATSAPARIASEITMLNACGGKHNVMPLITALRHEDQVLLVMPYFEHHDFRILLHAMSVDDIRCYIHSLIEAVGHVHACGIIHRDVKPSNFLYDFHRRRGMLVDFGLAQRTTDITLMPDSTVDSSAMNAYAIHAKKRPPGYFTKDTRPSIRATRAGTRGFRAPEVLFKVVAQTTAVDMWSIGVTLLCLMTRQYPFFHSPDDQESIVEIACMYGHENMKQVARHYNRTWHCNVSTVPEKGVSWKMLCEKFNPLKAPTFTPVLYDLLDKLMQLIDDERVTATDALDHPFFNDGDTNDVDDEDDNEEEEDDQEEEEESRDDDDES